MNMKRLNAVITKELQDIKTNWNQLFMYMLPIGMTLLYKNVFTSGEMPKGTILMMGLLMIIVLVGIMIPAMMVAEEKEKKTLEVLLLSPAKPIEIFTGKSFVTFISLIISMFIIMFIDNENWSSLLPILVSTSLASIFCIVLGIITGIFSKNQMATGVVGAPLAMIFLMVPLFSIMGIKQMEGIAHILPTYYYVDILKKITYENGGFGDILSGLAILVAGIIVACVLLLFLLKRKGIE